MFNNAPPAIPIFLDNSNINLSGDQSKPGQFKITGSPSNNEFTMLNNAFQPYSKIFSGEDYDSLSLKNISDITQSFVTKFPGSYVSPFAIVRYMQATQNGIIAEQLFNSLTPSVKQSEISAYL